MSGDDPQPPRAHKRYEVDWRVSMTCPDWHVAGSLAAANASRAGLFLLTTQPPPVGALVELGVELPDGTILRLRGIVQHVVTPERAAATGQAAGMGVKFLEEHETDLVLLEQMAAAATPAAPPPAPPPAPAPAPRTGSGPVLAQIAVKRRLVRPSGDVAPIVGIDLGTSFASVSGAAGGRLFVIPDDRERTRQPCVVHISERGLTVGWDARERLVERPRQTVVAPRRLLGRAFSDPALAVPLASSLVRIVPAEDGTPRVESEGLSFDAERLCGALFAHLRAQAERELRAPVARAVLAVAPHFDEPRRSALRRAAEQGGLEVADLVPAPVCAALASGASPSPGQRVVVFDAGGGTVEVSLLEGAGESFRLVASEHDEQLGGDPLDLAVAQAVADAFWRLTGIELRARLDAWIRLVQACETAKRALSTEEEAHIVVDALIEAPERHDLNQRIDRPRFEAMAREVLDRSLGACRLLLRSAGVDPATVSAVVAAGGSARVPLFRRGLAELFGREPLCAAQPDEVTCLGAGLRAAEICRHPVQGTGYI